jgi:hypothetical protein
MDMSDKDLDIINNLKNKRDIDGLLKLLKSTTVKVVIETVCVLSEYKDSKIIGPLIKLLNHKDNKVRESVVLALGELKDDRAFKPLVKALNDDDDNSVRKSAIMSLVKLNDKMAYKHIEKKLKDSDSSISKYAADALVEIDEKRAHATLKDSIDFKIENIDVDVKDRNKSLKRLIILALTIIPLVKLVFPEDFNIIKHSNIFLEFFINFFLLFLICLFVFVPLIFRDEFLLKDSIRIYANGFLINEDDFRKIFREKLSTVYKIKKSEKQLFKISVPGKKRKLKNVVIYYAADFSNPKKDLIIFISKFRSLNDYHQKALMKIIEESYFECLITPI